MPGLEVQESRAGQKVRGAGACTNTTPTGPPDPDTLLLVLAPHQVSAGSAGVFVPSTVPFCSGIPAVPRPLPSFIPKMGWLARGRSPKTEWGAIRAREPNGLWGQTHIW